MSAMRRDREGIQVSQDKPQTTANDDCVVCGGDGEIPIFSYAIPPEGPDCLPCPFCHPELCNDQLGS